MKQKIMVLALLGVPMFVSADVTLYGHIKGGLAVENIKRESLGEEIYKNDSKTNTVVQDYASRIGFKGEEDLGNGLKTIWQSEQFVSLGGNRKGWSTRETFIGLKGDAGTVKIGYLRNVFDSNMRNIDPWEYDLMGWTATNGLGHFNRVALRLAGSVRYDTPNMNGFSGNVMYSTKANRAADGFTQIDSDKGADATFLGVAYQNSGFFAKYGFGLYNKNALSTNIDTHVQSAKNTQVHRLLAGYNANNLLLVGAVQYTQGFDSLNSIRGTFMGNTMKEQYLSDEAKMLVDNNIDASHYLAARKDGVKRTELALTAAYTMGAWTPKITYAHANDIKTLGNYGKINNTKFDQVIVGTDYSLSKRTTAVMSVGWLRQGLGQSYSTMTAEDGSQSLVQHNDKYQATALSLGLKHVF